MTRFARAKGSKASNERVPEEATSWAEMKQQLLEKNKEADNNKKQQEANKTRIANYKAFLEEKEKSELKDSSWATFPSDVKTAENTRKNVKDDAKMSVRNKDHVGLLDKDSSDEEFSLLRSKVDQVLSNMINAHNEDQLEKESETTKLKQNKRKTSKTSKVKQPSESVTQKPEIKQNAEQLIQSQILNRNTTDSDSEGPPEEESSKNELAKSEGKVNNNESNQTNKSKDNLSEKDLKKIEKKEQRRLRQVLKRKQIKAELKKQKEEMENKNTANHEEISSENPCENISVRNREMNGNRGNNYKEKTGNLDKTNMKVKKAKIRDKEDHSRRKPFLPHTMFINGKELEIEYVDGFPVKKDDAERLKKLRKEMISKGLPRSEINIALKLERRKAEKAFAREKKKVCFNCRKSGHNLSECPELNKNQVAQTAGSGICFKCGSTEHTHFECKVVRNQEFKFAQCFICNEQGHIARQCPDNARGLYPKGGACRVCGDVTHLKKDCPTYQAQQQKQENDLKIETFGDSNPDILEGNEHSNKIMINKIPNKVVKF
ncbi:hypothetical protein NQ318_021834 [Aromia moschata]|uniref:CCHC-type domain-containing protein n=1 Tax=Aromia moschata TaxID=1265417 RepID=A0AAV8Z6J7_9CUCU|nr:hypothetical protein NQ318_021834 [Aromia moschata]